MNFYQLFSNFLATFYQLFINVYQLFINMFINILSTFYQLVINFLSTFYQLFINFLSTLNQLFVIKSLSTFLATLYQLFINVLSTVYQLFLNLEEMITFDICETLFALLPGHYVLGFTSCGRARVQPGTHKGEGLANQISMHSQFDGLHALQELRRERNKRYRDRAAHSLVYVFFFFCHSTCNQGQKREKGRTPAGALMSLPLLDAFHTCQSLCKVH